MRPRVLHLVGIALIFVTAQEQRASVAVMRSLPSGGGIEERNSSSAPEQCHRSQDRSPRTAFLQRLNRSMRMLPLRCPAMSKRGFHTDAPGPHPAPCFGWLRSAGGAPAAPTRALDRSAGTPGTNHGPGVRGAMRARRARTQPCRRPTARALPRTARAPTASAVPSTVPATNPAKCPTTSVRSPPTPR